MVIVGTSCAPRAAMLTEEWLGSFPLTLEDHFSRFSWQASTVHAASVVVMKPAGQDDQRRFGRAIDEAVGVVDTAGPVSRQVTAQWLGLADTGEGIAYGVLNQCIDALEGLPILSLPIQMGVPSIRNEFDAAHFQPSFVSSRVRDYAWPARS